MTFRNRQLLDLAEGQHCTNCGAKDGTVVAAHSNLQEHGRGHAHQAHDCYHAWLCWKCHSWLDHGAVSPDPSGLYQATKADKAEMFRRAMDRTQRYQWEASFVLWPKNADYLVHTANAYPKLVEALRDIAGLVYAYPGHFKAHEASMDAYLDNARALLRALGELE